MKRYLQVNSHNDKSTLQELSPKAKVSYDDTKFEVEFDVREFRPEELSIKTDGDVLVVLAKHETKACWQSHLDLAEPKRVYTGSQSRNGKKNSCFL